MRFMVLYAPPQCWPGLGSGGIQDSNIGRGGPWGDDASKSGARVREVGGGWGSVAQGGRGVVLGRGDVCEWSAIQEVGSRVAVFSKWPRTTAKGISLGGSIVALTQAGTRY